MGLLPLETGGEGYHAPSPDDFTLPPLFPDVPWLAWLDKYMLQAIVATILIIIFWLVMARKRQMVPGKGQFIGETAYFFVRNSIARDNLGHDFRKFLPWLIALFSFILINNLWGIFPFTLMPTTAHAGWAYGLAIMVWVVYNGVGIAKHGFGGYLKLATLPAGVPVFMWWLIIPLEFFSNIIVRPVTLALRLFANMLAGHILLILFALGGEYLLVHGEGLVKPVGIVAWLMFIVIAFLELLVQALQAYVFTLLSALYISGAIAEEH